MVVQEQALAETRPRSRYGWLAGALLLLAAMYPALGLGRWGHLAWTTVFWLVLLGCLRVVVAHPRVKTAARMLGWVAIAGSVASLWCFSAADRGHGITYLAIHGLSLAFLSFTTATTLWDVFGHPRVTGQTLVGAACGYVLLGLTFAFAMLVLHSLGADPLVWAGTSAAPSGGSRETARYLYFSFVTLSTLGYGDMIPRTPVAEVLAPAEAVIGQLYLAVFIARLIGMHVSRVRRCQHCGRIQTEQHL